MKNAYLKFNDLLFYYYSFNCENIDERNLFVEKYFYIILLIIMIKWH